MVVSKIMRTFAIEMIEIKDIHGKTLAMVDASTLEFADLSGLSLNYANLRGANLRHANLQFTDFTFACLDDADMTEADTNGMILDGASCEGLQIRLRHNRPHYM